MATPYNQVSGDAQVALNEFSTQFDAALAVGSAEPWARTLGLYNQSRAIKTTYPIPFDAAGYKLRKGDDKMRDLFERSLSMKPQEWQDGVAVNAHIVEAPDFVGWAGAPARMANEADRFPNKITATMLEANPLLDLYADEHLGIASTIELFHDAHPVNIFKSSLGTFDNDHGVTGSSPTALVGALKAAMTRFRARKGANGEPMGLRLTHVLAPGALEQDWRDVLENDLLINAITNVAGTENVGGAAGNNRFKGSIKLVVADELTASDKFYFLDASSGRFPWVVQDGGAPEEIVYTKDDSLYKDTGKIGVKYVLLAAVRAALPHAIERITVS